MDAREMANFRFDVVSGGVRCESCADSCDSFSDDAQMRMCAELCQQCATTCREMSVTGAA